MKTLYLKGGSSIKDVLINPAVLAWCCSEKPEVIDAIETVFELLNLSLRDRTRKEIVHIDDASEVMTILLIDKDHFSCECVFTKEEYDSKLDEILFSESEPELLLDEP